MGVFYGVYRADESGDRPTLLLEMGKDKVLTDFSEEAVLYKLRSRVEPRLEIS